MYRLEIVELTQEERGAVFAEYVAVLLLVSLIVAIAVASLGVPLWNLYRFSETVISFPFP